MRRAVGMGGMLCLLSSLALLLAAPAPGWAAPTIEAYTISHLTNPCGYERHVCVDVSADAVSVEMTPPGGSATMGYLYQYCPQTSPSGLPRHAWEICGQPEPLVGTYLFRVTGPGGETVLESGETTTFPAKPLAWASPMPNAVLGSTRPTLSWVSYDGFSSEGGSLTSTNVTVGGPTGTWGPLLSRDCIEGDHASDTSWQYNTGVCYDGMVPEELWPGRYYTAQVEVWSVGHAFPNGGWYREGATTGAATFAVAGPTPLFEYVALTGGARLFPDGRTVYGERAYAAGSDLNGGDQLQIQVHDPSNLFRKQTGTLQLDWQDVFGHAHIWEALDLPSLEKGTYMVEMTDRATDAQISLVYHTPAPSAPAITSPRNGAVIPAGEVVEFAWQPLADQCTYQMWMEEIPASDVGGIFEWTWRPQTLTFADSRSLWCPWSGYICLPGDATSVAYRSGRCAEPLESGHRYRFHLMATAGQGEPVTPMWPDTLPMRIISESMVDFTVE